jgi:predicted nucleic acid-binding protein
MPFTKTTASADTCVLSDFIMADRVSLLFHLFPEGIRVDASVIVELQEQFGASVREQVSASGCDLLIERAYEAAHYAEMAEIKRHRPGMRHADITTVVLAGKYQGTCLSSDGAVRKTCQERSILVSGHLGCLQAGVERALCSSGQAADLVSKFMENGLYLPDKLVTNFLKKMQRA